MNRPTTLASALWLAMAATAHAETSADAAGAPINEFQRVQVTATRGERALADVPNTVDIIDREQLDDRLIRNIKDLARYEPGVSVSSGFGRFTSASGFRIRGLEKKRCFYLAHNKGACLSPIAEHFLEFVREKASRELHEDGQL